MHRPANVSETSKLVSQGQTTTGFNEPIPEVPSLPLGMSSVSPMLIFPGQKNQPGNFEPLHLGFPTYQPSPVSMNFLSMQSVCLDSQRGLLDSGVSAGRPFNFSQTLPAVSPVHTLPRGNEMSLIMGSNRIGDLGSEVPASSDSKEAKKTKEAELPRSTFFELFYFAGPKQRVYLYLAIFLSVLQGFCLPGFSILFGQISYDLSTSMPDNVLGAAAKNAGILLSIGVVTHIFAQVAVILWNKTLNDQLEAIKLGYFAALLRKNTTWYDRQRIEALSAQYMEDVGSLNVLFCEKMNSLFHNTTMAFSGFIVGIIVGWSYSLLLLALIPIVAIGGTVFGLVMSKQQDYQASLFARAGSVCEQTFSFIKTVKSLGGEEHETEKFDLAIRTVRDKTIRSNLKVALSFGLFFFSMLVMYSLAFYLGSRVIKNHWWNDNMSENYNLGHILSIFLGVTTGFLSLGSVIPVLKDVVNARIAMGRILYFIRNKDEEFSGVYAPAEFHGLIEFENVSFSYPSNPDRKILQNLSVRILPGQKVGIIGPSGGGKSTIIQLLMRYYDPTAGRITIDGVDIRDFDLKYLRARLGLVMQQPVLFADTVRVNLLMGIEHDQIITDEQMEEALTRCKAREFVANLKEGLDEFVGNLGEKLSGGQKQRLAIARTLLRNPTVLVFDEATSALDRRNEAAIQKTIDEVSKGKTSITIAHRLVTVKNSDLILVLKDGLLIERGNHKTLMEIPSSYYRELVEKQTMSSEEGPETGDSDLEEDREVAEISEVSQTSRPADVHETRRLLAPIQPLESQTQAPLKEKTKKEDLRLMEFMTDSKWIIVAGMVAAAVNGSVMPVFGTILGFVISNLGKLDALNKGAQEIPGVLEYDQVESQIHLHFGLFLMLAVISYIASSLQYYIFVYIGDRYSYNIRYQYFRRTLFQDMAYHDSEENTPGAISSRLSNECKSVNSLISTYLGTICQSVSAFLVGNVVAICFSWRLGLVGLGLSPLLLVYGLVDSKIINRYKGDKRKGMGQNTILPDVMNNMRLVRSLNGQKVLLQKFKVFAADEKAATMKHMHLRAFFMGLAQLGMYIVYAGIFFFGAVFISRNEIDFEKTIIVMFLVVFGGYGAGIANQFLGNIAEAHRAARLVVSEIRAKNQIEVDSQNPGRTTSKIGNFSVPRLKGHIEFRDVCFAFSKTTPRVLKHVSFEVPVLQSHAIVGPSGSGKSTIMQLLLRFYDVSSGQILIDGVDVRDFDLKFLRASLGIVRQEPSLFNGDVEYNIRYNRSDLTIETLDAAMKSSNSLEFVEREAQGSKRDVGNRSEKLSGGQKQRLAIARIIARNPAVFLFDEATSALDSASEKVVQQALEQISQNTTSLTIAHRISTIQNCNKIIVLKAGRVREQGSYAELMKLRGIFYELAHE